ncbi:Cdc6/Cdc18 family protein [Promethearchaeum syntrophicum]|uniref:ORC1-type DNA replication protein n=1 Tax=Promethearchaeum syntrophicum TaxID=2594042 RepID=A0A5B9D8D5_9ARCH|nr:TniB family NTP-binding protein [Candidatus Prometheoarchaeum syntrophicum]QEE14866.1 ORC1-type DNA replication protein 2 [Candidatus Prometheoarchaeum syntrophicum]
MTINYLEDQYCRNSLFLNEKYFEVNYLPDQIKHREQELIMLSKIFIKLIETPFRISRKVMIHGDVGIGKTAITRTFGRMLLLSAKKRNIKIKYVHINCRIEKSNFKILNQVLRKLNIPVPIRGFSPQDLITMLQDYLIKNEIYLVLVLDELNHIQNFDTNFDIIYSLTRMNDSDNGKNFLSLIVIVRDITLLRNLDESTISTLQGNILTLKKYTINQIVDILNFRIDKGLKKGIITESNVHLIAEKISDSGDIRKGLNIIRNAVKITEAKDKSHVSGNELQIAFNNLIPSLQDDALSILTYHMTLLLYVITVLLMERKEKRVIFSEIQKKYEEICFLYQETPKKSTQIWNNLQSLKNYSLIKIKTISKKVKGRKSYCSINSIPINILNEELNQKIRNFLSTR